jgi:hypothetical protein
VGNDYVLLSRLAKLAIIAKIKVGRERELRGSPPQRKEGEIGFEAESVSS